MTAPVIVAVALNGGATLLGVRLGAVLGPRHGWLGLAAGFGLWAASIAAGIAVMR